MSGFQLQIELELRRLSADRIVPAGIGFDEERHLSGVTVETMASRIRSAGRRRRRRRRATVQQLQFAMLLHVDVGSAKIG